MLSTLNVGQISEVARYQSPPGGVKLVMMGVCIMMGIGPAMVGEVGKKQPDYWPKAKTLLQNPAALLDSLMKYDRDNIPDKIIQKIEPLGMRGRAYRVASQGKEPQRRPQKRLDRRLEEVVQAVGGGYCRLQMLLKLALGVRGTVAGHRLGALEGGGGVPPLLPMHSLGHSPPTPRVRAASALAVASQTVAWGLYRRLASVPGSVVKLSKKKFFLKKNFLLSFKTE